MYKLIILFICIQNIFSIINQHHNINSNDCIVKYISNDNICTGSFIMPNTFITAAHCIVNSTDIDYIVNMNNKVVNIKKYHINFIYNKQHKLDDTKDVALIVINKFYFKCSNYFNIYNSQIGVNGEEVFTSCGFGCNNNIFSFNNNKKDKLAGCVRTNFTYNKFKNEIVAYSVTSKLNNYYTSCEGDSGSPLFKNNMIYGVITRGSFNYNKRELIKNQTDLYNNITLGLMFNTTILFKYLNCTGGIIYYKLLFIFT